MLPNKIADKMNIADRMAVKMAVKMADNMADRMAVKMADRVGNKIVLVLGLDFVWLRWFCVNMCFVEVFLHNRFDFY